MVSLFFFVSCCFEGVLEGLGIWFGRVLEGVGSPPHLQPGEWHGVVWGWLVVFSFILLLSRNQRCCQCVLPSTQQKRVLLFLLNSIDPALALAHPLSGSVRCRPPVQSPGPLLVYFSIASWHFILSSPRPSDFGHGFQLFAVDCYPVSALAEWGL